MRTLYNILIIWVLALTSCSPKIEYKRVSFEKHSAPGRTMREVMHESRMRNFDGGTVFVHYGDSLIQLSDVSYFNDTTSREFNAVISTIDPEKVKLYEYMNKYPEGNYPYSDSSPPLNDFKQMHFYVDGLLLHEQENMISVSEDEIEQYDKYYPKIPRNVHIVMGVILGGVLVVPVVVLLIMYLAWG